MVEFLCMISLNKIIWATWKQLARFIYRITIYTFFCLRKMGRIGLANCFPFLSSYSWINLSSHAMVNPYKESTVRITPAIELLKHHSCEGRKKRETEARKAFRFAPSSLIYSNRVLDNPMLGFLLLTANPIALNCLKLECNFSDFVNN